MTERGENKESGLRKALATGAKIAAAAGGAWASMKYFPVATPITAAYGAFAYSTGRWPFAEVEDRVYIPLQLFNEDKGRVLEGPGTSVLLSPLEKPVTETKDVNGEQREVPVMIPARDMDRDFPDFAFTTGTSSSDGGPTEAFPVTAHLQYTYRIPNKKAAKKFFWTVQRQRGMEMIDQIVRGRVSNNLNKHKYAELEARSGPEAWEPIVEQCKDVEKRYGVQIVSISVDSYVLGEEAREILNRPVQEAMDGQAKRIRANTQVETSRSSNRAAILRFAKPDELREIVNTEYAAIFRQMDPALRAGLEQKYGVKTPKALAGRMTIDDLQAYLPEDYLIRAVPKDIDMKKIGDTATALDKFRNHEQIAEEVAHGLDGMFSGVFPRGPS